MRVTPIASHRWFSFVQLSVLLAVAAAVVPARQAAADTTADRVLGQLAFPYNGANLVDARGVSVPRGVAIDRSVVPNRLYVADTNNNRVLAWADVTAFASGGPAALVIGQPDFFSSSCNTGGISAVSLCAPVGLAVDAAGNLYVADVNNSRVLEYDSPFASGATADRVFGQAGGFTTGVCNLPGLNATGLCFPWGVAVDAGGNLYVADASNSRVLEYDTPLVSGVTADRVFGQGGSFTSNSCNLGGVTASGLCNPLGTAVDGAGNVYVADSGNSRVLEYDTPLASGVSADRVFGQGGSFTSNGCDLGGISATSLCGPVGVAVDPASNLYIGDESNHRVLEYDTPLVSGVTADRVFGQGGSFTTATCNVASATSLCNPDGVATDATGNLYVADLSNSRVLEYDTPLVSGVTADRVLGQLAFVYSGPNFVDARGVFAPRGVAVDRSTVPSRVYVADTSNNRVLGWASAAAFVDGAPADLVIGQPDFLSSSCNSGGLSATSLCSPIGVAVDAGGNLYVADASNSRVLEYDAPFATDAAADRVFGQGGSFTTGTCNLGGVSATSLCSPVGVAMDPAGDLYVADQTNSRVLEYDTPLASGVTADRVFGQGGSFTLGTCNLGGVSATSLCSPVGVAMDPAGDLYVADQTNSRVLEYDTPLASGVTADRVFGQGGSFASGTCNLGGVSATSLCNPAGIAVGTDGNLYVTDQSNNRLLEYDTPLVSGVTADRVFGQGGSFASSTCNLGGASATSLCTPSAVSVDTSGDLYAADSGNHRVLEYDDPVVVCGNGVVEAGETCDDGNTAAGDCCSPTCTYDAPGTACTSDGNVCTNDVCNGAGACLHPNNTAPCDDGLFCNGADTCGGGTCTHAGNPCTGGSECADTCNEAADNCFDPAGTACTSDGNVCTNDQCNGSGACTHPNNTAPCDDGLFCTGADICSGGACTHAGSPCAGGPECADTCNEAADNCFDAAGTACTSDGNVCTNDQCNGTGACTHPNNTASCDDGLFCNGADTCSGGTCAAHAGNPCAGGPECADTCNEAADNCFDPAGTACTSDGNVCTNDQCNGTGACTHPNNTAPCNDGLFCNGSDTCSGGTCTHTGNPCTGGPECADTCNEAADNCFDPAGTGCTSDGNVCTNDQCNGTGACAHPNNAAPCDDGLFCNGADTCSGGACTHAGDPCTGGPECAVTCNEAADNCFDPSGTACTVDGDPCTLDQCDGSGTCAHPTGNDGAACSDGDDCTSGEICSGGACTGGTPITCPLCQTCNPAGGCLAAPRSTCKLPTQAGKAQLILRDFTPDAKDQVVFKWTRGQATTFADLGNPLATDDYALCLFDGTGDLLLKMTAPAGGTCGSRPCWKQIGRVPPKGFKYKDRDGLPDDLDGITIRAGGAGAAKLTLKGKGDNIPLPPLGPTLMLPLKAQLQSENGQCYEGTFSTPLVNSTLDFKAKSD